MNLKWASDTIDRLLAAANVRIVCGLKRSLKLILSLSVGLERDVLGHPGRHPAHRGQDAEGEKGWSYLWPADTPTIPQGLPEGMAA